MKVTWKNKKKKLCLPALSYFIEDQPFPQKNNDAEEDGDGLHAPNPEQSQHSDLEKARQLAKEFQAQGDNLAVDGKYREALGKWETALTLAPDVPVLHEQKAQVLLEIGDAWNALKAATRATELEPSWAEAWVTLGRAQLNFGEPDNAIESFDRALALKPDYEETRDDRKTALNLVKKRKQLHSSGLSATQNRYAVGDKDERS
ncbi:uncharacterized protein LOC133314690 [Gastrolobium bilobum]|uniref:uncharacterized protein LOC133314690 n=1 Tax=Gastrolobium bilobum TaxID=150636 RepID=UPI002AAFAAF4|nr:uncharacterized protein LOC133314690 [Gastrolobium bilobum]